MYECTNHRTETKDVGREGEKYAVLLGDEYYVHFVVDDTKNRWPTPGPYSIGLARHAIEMFNYQTASALAKSVGGRVVERPSR